MRQPRNSIGHKNHLSKDLYPKLLWYECLRIASYDVMQNDLPYLPLSCRLDRHSQDISKGLSMKVLLSRGGAYRFDRVMRQTGISHFLSFTISIEHGTIISVP